VSVRVYERVSMVCIHVCACLCVYVACMSLRLSLRLSVCVPMRIVCVQGCPKVRSPKISNKKFKLSLEKLSSNSIKLSSRTVQ
jgi:hypothetical protein